MVSEFIEIMLDDCYHLKQWSKKLESQSNILDIGGNIGLFSLAARQYFPEATIHSYEPNPRLETYLSHQAKVGNFDYYMSGIGQKDGKLKLNFSDKKASMNTTSIVDEKGNITMLSFEKAVEKLKNNIDLLKMDCEGAEWDILQATDVWKKIKNLELEYHLYKKGQTLEKIQNMIKQMGFKIIKCKPTNQYYGNLTAIRV